jgi:hypothetical protein
MVDSPAEGISLTFVIELVESHGDLRKRMLQAGAAMKPALVYSADLPHGGRLKCRKMNHR